MDSHINKSTKKGTAAFLLSAILLFLCSLSDGGCAPSANLADRPPVVLITVDTTRADHLGCYGYGKNTSPNIDRLASSGVKFTNCYISMPSTDPSHISILTSTYPRTHGVLKNGMEITNPDVTSLAEWFKGRGYETAAITSKQYLNPQNLKLNGFDYVSAPKRGMKAADEVSGEALEFIEARGKGGFFLWVHFFDPHTSYAPPLPYVWPFVGKFDGQVNKQYAFLGGSERWTEQEIAYTVGLYDGEIRYMDQHIGKIIDRLTAGFSTTSMSPFIILVADHGETLGELQESHGFVFDHGKFLYNRTVKAPLIMSWKGKLPEGKTLDQLVESIDIAPTIIALMEGEKPERFSGISFERSIFDASVEHKRYAFIQRRYFEKPPQPYLDCDQTAIVSKDYKLIENPITGIELYDLKEDGGEKTNIASAKPEVAKELQARIAEWKEQYPPVKADYVVSKEKLENLRALGYLP
jgi:arylsulfatase A-like enzyme